MTDSVLKILLPLSFAVFCIYVLYGLVSQPGSFAGYAYLGALIGVEVLAVMLWNYRQTFFAILLLVFLWAGTMVPWQSAGLSARWLVLAAGAAVGFALYMKGNHSFGAIHLLALFCLLSALVSAMESSYPRLALLKTGSLALVFLYGSGGARVSILGREAKFIAGLLLGCEFLVYFSAFEYFVLHEPFFGNPNSLGVVTGIVTTPILLWGVIVSEGTRGYPRRLLALLVSTLLLLSSYSRAGIGASLISCILLCVAMRRYRLLLKGGAVVLAGAVLIAATVPLPDHHDVHTDSLTDVFLYKGKTEAGVFGSRVSPWAKTSAVIRERPWFGSGFGTSVTGVEGPQLDYAVESRYGSIREHGNSYFAILEWVGLLGIVPFLMLLVIIAVNVGRATAQMFRSANPMSPLVPITGVLIAGIFHAAFEDWMFAPGYYMCVFFWSLVFIQADLVSATEPVVAEAANRYPAAHLHPGYGILSPGR
jgi:O-antigen ligase